MVKGVEVPKKLKIKLPYQDHPHGKEMQRSKMAVWGGLTNTCEKKRGKKQRRKGKIQASECRVPKNTKKR